MSWVAVDSWIPFDCLGTLAVGHGHSYSWLSYGLITAKISFPLCTPPMLGRLLKCLYITLYACLFLPRHRVISFFIIFIFFIFLMILASNVLGRHAGFIFINTLSFKALSNNNGLLVTGLGFHYAFEFIASWYQSPRAPRKCFSHAYYSSPIVFDDWVRD